MSRPNRRKEEIVTESALLNDLREGGHKVEKVDREIEENPDSAFRVDDITVACDCTQIPPHRIFKWVHTQFEHDSPAPNAATVVWPEEPHSWVREAIDNKLHHAEGYRANVEADEVWLLIHTPIRDSQIFVRGKVNWEAQMLRFGASSIDHNFDRIYFWEPRSGVQQIYPPRQPVERVEFDFSKGYPARSFCLFGGFKFTTPEEGEPPRKYEYEIVEPDQIRVPPIDPEFKRHEPDVQIYKYKVEIVAKPHSYESSVTRIPYDAAE